MKTRAGVLRLGQSFSTIAFGFDSVSTRARRANLPDLTLCPTSTPPPLLLSLPSKIPPPFTSNGRKRSSIAYFIRYCRFHLFASLLFVGGELAYFTQFTITVPSLSCHVHGISVCFVGGIMIQLILPFILIFSLFSIPLFLRLWVCLLMLLFNFPLNSTIVPSILLVQTQQTIGCELVPPWKA